MKTLLRLAYGLLYRTEILKIRKNHALEHATIHVLSSRFPHRTIAGRSDRNGFFLLGTLDREAVLQAVHDARQRLIAGERSLAVHPNCGTNFLTAGVLAGGGSYLTLLGNADAKWHERLNRLPLAIMIAVLGLLFSTPLGNAFQKHVTTHSDIQGLEILDVRQTVRGRTVIHRVLTQSQHV